MAVLFLQGPLGSFFNQLSIKLNKQGTRSYKINFNAGDALYNSFNATCYKGSVENWPIYLEQYIKHYNITNIFVYGDCRTYHRLAKSVAKKTGVNFYVFEEGYLRPNRITLEKNGVNGYKAHCINEVSHWKEMPSTEEVSIGSTLFNRAIYCINYYIAASFLRWRYPHYQHHRSLSASGEAIRWINAGKRHFLYQLPQKLMFKKLLAENRDNYFVFPLQVFNDAQIQFHSQFSNMGQAIQSTIKSFSQHAPESSILVIKHHPMDRGHVHYGKLIKKLSKRYDVIDRVMYVHDLHLPTLLKSSKGVVTINSTTALSAFYHETPVKVLGDAFYNLPGLCSQKTLAEFWQAPCPVDKTLFQKLKNYLISHGQVNGSFYKKTSFTIDNLIQEMQKLGILARTLEKQESNSQVD